MPQAYVYIRFSTTKQEKGSSVERQLEDCKAYCERKGWPIVETIRDLGRSAWKGDHLKSGELGAFAARVHAGEIPPGSVLVVEKLDRLSRQEVRFTQRWLEDICATGLSIATVSGDRVYDDETLRNNLMSTLEVLLIGKLAHDESQNKSERIGDSWRRKQEKAKAGIVMTTKTPGWLRVKDDRSGLEQIPIRVDVVREVYEKAASGHGARSIAKSLNERGIASWGDARKSGKMIGWTAGFIADLLASPAVEGEYHPNYRPKRRNRSPNPTMGYYERVVDADLVARARTAMAGRSGASGRNSQNFSNLFSGLVYCCRCKGKMTLRRTPVTKADGSKRYDAFYQCSNAYNGLVCDQREFFNYAKFEPVALDAILHLALDDRFFSQAASSVHLAIKVAEIEKSLASKRDQAKRLVRLIASYDDMQEAEEELRDVRRDIREDEAAIEAAREDLARAKGEVPLSEHMRRVFEVRDAIDHQDDETRIAARRKVTEAIKSLGCRVDCRVDNLDETVRTFRVNFGGGALILEINNKGQVIKRNNLLDDLRELVDHKAGDALNEALQKLDGVAKKIIVRGLNRSGIDDVEGKADILIRRLEQKDNEEIV